MKSNPLKNCVGNLRPRSGQENSHSVENTSISGLWKYHNRRRVNCLFIVILDRDWFLIPNDFCLKAFSVQSGKKTIWRREKVFVAAPQFLHRSDHGGWGLYLHQTWKTKQKRRKRKKNTVSVTSWARLISAPTAKENWKTNSTEKNIIWSSGS